ncbi:hypothetical protein [Sutcliffiella deserti]|uniref:hypothetical protein n=1 Tax=Sutcliffiella deserti TaxID=2875501 RepID=UPI001CC14EDF|nr:hypothetical protein [Sutcliffiella deserti]
MKKRVILISLLIMALFFVVFLYTIVDRPNNIEEAMKEVGIEGAEVLHHQIININKNDSVVIYKLKEMNGIRFGLVNEDRYGWKWEQHLGDIRMIGEFKNGFSSEYISLPERNYSVIFGSIMNQELERVTVSYPFGLEKYVELVEIDEKLTVWFTKWNFDDRRIIIKAGGKENFINEEL